MIQFKVMYNQRLQKFSVYRSKEIDLCGNVKSWVIRASFNTIKECNDYTGNKLNLMGIPLTK